MRAVLTVVLLLASVPAAAGPDPEEPTEPLACFKVPANRRVRLTFKRESEISDAITWIASLHCRSFILPAGLNLAGRKLTVLAPEEVTVGEAWALFLALLDSVGLAVEPAGKALRIIEAAKAPRSPIGSEKDSGIITRLLRVRHVDVNEVMQLLQGFRSESGSIAVHARTGTLIVTDRAASVERLAGLLAALDQPGEALKLWRVPARHLSATELAAQLVEVAGLPEHVLARGNTRSTPPAAPGAPAPAIARVIPDERNGRVLIVATEAAFAPLLGLAETLDVKAQKPAGQVHVYRCRHADCDAVAGILGTLTGVAVARAPATEGRAARPTPTAPADPQRGPETLFQGEVRVTADPSTNALVVMSSLEDFRVLRRLAEEVDVARKQVFVEASIMEVLVRKDRKVGVGYHAGRTIGGGVAVGGFEAQHSLLLGQGGLGAALTGLSALAVGAPLTNVAKLLGLPTESLPSVGAFIQLLQQDEDVNLVANPHLLITNNHEGQISVGQRIPFQGAFAPAGGAAGVPGLLPVVSVTREDVALTLKLTPHVNDDDLIRLEIDQEMSEVAITGPLGPSTTKRTAKTTVFARDQQTVVIGGLMRDKVSEGMTKVPILGDIPLLGLLFRSTQKTVEKQNIILALTPYVIDEPGQLVRVLEAKVRERREFIERFGTPEERRSLTGPLGPSGTPGMLARINRAARELEAEAPVAEIRTPVEPQEGVPLPPR